MITALEANRISQEYCNIASKNRNVLDILKRIEEEIYKEAYKGKFEKQIDFIKYTFSYIDEEDTNELYSKIISVLQYDYGYLIHFDDDYVVTIKW